MNQYKYMDSNLSTNERILNLLELMTLDEKIRQLDMFWGKEITEMGGNHEAMSFSRNKIAEAVGKTGIGSIHDLYPINADLSNEIQKFVIENSRLGIPVLFIEEGLHGYEGLGSTTFPIPLHIASSWDTSLVKQIGNSIAAEARAHGIHMLLSPVLCLARDPRWGRVEETFGEDIYCVSEFGLSMINGLQGKDIKDSCSVVSVPKHYAMHSIPEGGSNFAPVTIGEREARSSFLYPFEKVVRKGTVRAIMAAYNEFDGIPCVTNEWLLRTVLREEWDFRGFVLSDMGAIRMALNTHKIANDIKDILSQVIKAGVNMQFYDFPHNIFLSEMKQAISNGQISVGEIDFAVGDILRLKFDLGLFDDPYVDSSLLTRVLHSKKNQKLALKAAHEGICLLKNENNILPIKKTIKNITIIGQLATSNYLGGYSNKESKAISVLEGVKQRVGDSIEINYEEGYDSTFPFQDQTHLIRQACNALNNSNFGIVVIGENPEVIGEGKDKAILDLEEYQLNLLKELRKIRTPIVAVLINGRPLTINWVAENIPAIVEAWFSGEKSGLAIADILFGRVNPSGKLPISFPRLTGQIPYYYSHKPSSSHHYVNEQNTLLFPFGFGLSYATFEYLDINISPSKISAKGRTNVFVDIENTGDCEGTEIVQLYIQDVKASVTTPMIALKGFKRITLKSGEVGQVHFMITKEHLALWDRKMNNVVEPGEFLIIAGSSSNDLRLMDRIWVE